MQVTDINVEIPEGRLLIAAIAKITGESQQGKNRDEVFNQIQDLTDKIYPEDYLVKNQKKSDSFSDKHFEESLRILINRHSKEDESNTPDFILAVFLSDCLEAFNLATKRRDNWYGGKRSILESEEGTKWEIE